MTDYIERYWRDATPEDAIKEPPMVARFRDDELAGGSWERLTLIGYCRKTRINWRHLDGPWLDTDGDGWACCQVYDAPDPGEGWRLVDPEKESPEEGDELFAHGYWKTRRTKTDPFAKTFYYRRRIEQPKPDPGEGWRLIDPEKEKPQGGDEFFCPLSKVWCLCSEYLLGCGYSKDSFVRRRIEPPQPKYEPFRWEDREQLRGRWVTWKHEDGTPIEKPVIYLVKKESGELLINSRNSKWFLQNASFLDTGEPVGRRVQ